MSDEHMATAREVTRDWTPQTTLADSRRDIANALAAAEERGRRRGVEEAAKVCDERARKHDVTAIPTTAEQAAFMQMIIAQAQGAEDCATAIRNLAPRDSAPGLKLRSDPRFDPDDEIAPRDYGKEG